MATQHDPSSTAEPMFYMPQSAYERLLAVRDQLRLLATLIQRSQAEENRAEENQTEGKPLREVPLAPVAEGLSLVAGQLGEVLESVE